MKSLVLFISFVFFIGGSEYALSDTFYLTFQNTGSEDVYYSTAIRRMKFVGWGDWRASGWYALPAGSSKQVYAGSDEQVAFAFKKHGGYIKFNNRNSRSSKKWLKGWHVATKDVFDYRFKNKSKPSERLDGFVEMSFGYHYESRSWGTSHIVRQSVNINTSKNHKPIPWTRNARRAAAVSPDNFLEALDSAIEENKKEKSRKKDISPHADAPVSRTDPRVHKGDGSRLDRLLHEGLSNTSCYRMEGVLMTYPAFAAGVSEDGSVYVEGLENRVDGKLTDKAGRSSIPVDQVRDTRIVPSRSGAQPRCARLELRCPKKEKCARNEGVRRSSISLYFNSAERANEVAALLVPPPEDSMKAGAAPKPQEPASSSARPALVFSGKEETPQIRACKASIEANINGYTTTGDVRSACQCVEQVFAAISANIPGKYHEQYLYDDPDSGETYFDFSAILKTRSGKKTDEIARLAKSYAWDARICVGFIPTRSGLISHPPKRWLHTYRRLEKPEDWDKSGRIDYIGDILEPVEGPAREQNQGLSGLLYTDMRPLWYMVQEATLTKGAGDLRARFIARNESLQELQAYNWELRRRPLLGCSYQTKSPNNEYNRWQSTYHDYYWYDPEWEEEEIKGLLNNISSDHLFHQIGPERTTCPTERPE
jgi:hypothetical protein